MSGTATQGWRKSDMGFDGTAGPVRHSDAAGRHRSEEARQSSKPGTPAGVRPGDRADEQQNQHIALQPHHRTDHTPLTPPTAPTLLTPRSRDAGRPGGREAGRPGGREAGRP
ncbi:hypothetical protein, partial [Streptomyces acidiscabies]|uniref:hypothetical protein n=1 Tax=Streptomyces acidiscabies TaxID=42234 RepID=UPI001C4AFCC6